MDDYCEVSWEGSQGGTYYVACPLVEYISDELVNTGNSTIYFYTSPQQSNNSYALSASAFSYPRYYSGNNYYYVTNARNVSFNNRSNYYRERQLVDPIFSIIISAILFINLLIHRR